MGTVVAERKVEGLGGVPLRIVQPLNHLYQPSGDPLVAADAMRQAGRGELVYLTQSREAAQALEDSFVPVDAAIVGIVDAVDAEP
jgi:ethanolamine utilization protein EutN